MIDVYTDGSCKPDDHGCGTGGVVIDGPDGTTTIHAYFGQFYSMSATAAEWAAVWVAVRALNRRACDRPVVLHSDQQEVIRRLADDRSSPSLNMPYTILARRIEQAAESLCIRYQKIPRVENHRADRAADQARTLVQDEGGEAVYNMATTLFRIIDPELSRMKLEHLSPELFSSMDQQQKSRLKNRVCSKGKHEQYGRLKMQAQANEHDLDLTITPDLYTTLHGAVVHNADYPAYRCQQTQRLSSKRCWFRLTGPHAVEVLHNRRSDYLQGIRPLSVARSA